MWLSQNICKEIFLTKKKKEAKNEAFGYLQRKAIHISMNSNDGLKAKANLGTILILAIGFKHVQG